LSTGFVPQPTLTLTIGQFIKQNQEKIKAWLKSDEHSLRGEIVMKDPIGIVVEPGNSKVTQANKTFIMLVRDSAKKSLNASV
jgi:hypothetical protein